ncbi:MAG: putative sulfate exporter family transporter, partial [Planctomycetaceae bacterium]|nr:putative sulfate exporter family transporter [Planctomycetaceae bacterium]
ALLIGLLISNTIGTPAFMKPGVRTELYMKVGLVLLGAEVLFGKLLALGLPGVFIAWVVTPIVLISTFWFGQKVLKIGSPSLNMVISADMSVCGVSAAIATASACKAKKEELSTAIGISLAFTVVMMVVLPQVIKMAGLDPIVGGAWIGGTIDSTGAVGAAGAMLGEEAEVVATTIKMIQNILIGVVAFCVAVYWVTFVERTPDTKPDVTEIWRRFPKFILGFLAASIVMSIISERVDGGSTMVKTVIDGSTKGLRGWCFCLAFVSIGLETEFKTLLRFFKGGKPLVLYICGQTLNLCLTLFMSWLMFKVVFPRAADVLAK